MPEEPAARAVALVERLFALLHECRALVPQLEAAGTDPESVSAQARAAPLLRAGGRYRGRPGAHGRGRPDRLRQASAPLGPMGADWLAQQEGRLDQA
jgi:hypothetical protein